MNVYGPRIARARKLAGLTQEALAELLEVNVQTIKRHEQAGGKEPRKVDRLAIASVLGISEDYLEGRVADPLAATDDVGRSLAEMSGRLAELERRMNVVLDIVGLRAAGNAAFPPPGDTDSFTDGPRGLREAPEGGSGGGHRP